ncbi:DUF406 family protein [Pantoea sp. 1.19]|uniref:YfcZ/YiiS family protein n=1 Tax=Pantoea sp. 1.19 TaxID=1925589 RepID=UPI000949018F|nr:DUF406 family protein [Pantoea sp. 1.19]
MDKITSGQRAVETAACCCVDVGTIIDNRDCRAEWQGHFASEAAAQAMLDALRCKAQAVASEPCEIDATILAESDGYALRASVDFCCQAEAMIFQLALR